MFSPVAASREKATPVAEFCPILPKTIACTDRASLSELIVALNGYTVTSGILVGISDGALLHTIPLETEVELCLGYVTRTGQPLDDMGKRFVDKLEVNLQRYAARF